MTPRLELSALEARAIGCLIEKQITTPEQYPLSLNALTNACNQKSNRNPVLELNETAVQGLLDSLSRKHLVLEKSGFGSRVPKYQQRLCNTEFSMFQFTPQERAIVCELLLRGPQTPGELRTRAARMASFTEGAQVEQALENLARREDGPFVTRLAREPGRRDARYAHLFSGEVISEAAPEQSRTPTVTETADASWISRIQSLEVQVRVLSEQVAQLQAASEKTEG